MDEPMDETSTYMRPGINFSFEVLGGAREATVEVNDFSMLKEVVRTSFVLSSVMAAYLWRKRRTRAICVVRRSVGVGEVVFGCVGGEGVLGGGTRDWESS